MDISVRFDITGSRHLPRSTTLAAYLAPACNFNMLSFREREVMLGVERRSPNKQIANEIGISESTVKVHRTNLMRKMKARSVPELSRMADRLNIRLQQPQNF